MGRACTQKREKGSGPIGQREAGRAVSGSSLLCGLGRAGWPSWWWPWLPHQVRGRPSPRAQMLLFQRGVVLSVAGTVKSHPPPHLFPSLSGQLLLMVPPHLTPPTSPGQAPATAPPNNEDQGSGHNGFWIRTSFCPHEKNSMVTHLC